MQAFSMDNIVFRTIGKIVDIIWINLLTVICSLPVVTAGAAITAMFYNLLRMADNDEGALTRGFFSAFRENFKSATKVWLCELAAFVVLGYNLFLIRQGVMDGYGMLESISKAVILLILAVLIIFTIYVFCLMARYENSLKGTVKNAALVAVAFFPKSLMMLVLSLFPLALTMLHDYFLYFWFLYGLAVPGYLIAMLMRDVLGKLHPEEREEEEYELE